MANTQTTVPLFVANQVLTAAQQNASAGTGVPVFATTVTRDAAFGGSNKALAEGQLCYIEASNIVQYYDGAAWATVGPAAAGGLVFVSKTTIISQAATTINGLFTSTYNDYKVIITIGGVTDSNKLRFQLTSSGTPVTSGYAAGCFIGDYTSGTPPLINYGYAESANFVLGYVPNSATQNANIAFDMYGPQATQKTAINGQTTSVWSGAANAGGAVLGFLDSTTSYDGIKIYSSANTALTGTVVVYGYAKA